MAVTKHGLAGTPIYKCWENMRVRVRGGVGCDPLWSTFAGFLANPPAAGPSPVDGLTRAYEPGLCLCRTGDTGPYSPANCRWDTRRNNTIEQVRPVKLTDAQVAEIRTAYASGGVSQRALAGRFGVTQTQIHNIIRRKQRNNS